MNLPYDGLGGQVSLLLEIELKNLRVGEIVGFACLAGLMTNSSHKNALANSEGKLPQ